MSAKLSDNRKWNYYVKIWWPKDAERALVFYMLCAISISFRMQKLDNFRQLPGTYGQITPIAHPRWLSRYKNLEHDKVFIGVKPIFGPVLVWSISFRIAAWVDQKNVVSVIHFSHKFKWSKKDSHVRKTDPAQIITFDKNFSVGKFA